MLKIHCCAVGSQRNWVSGVVEATGSLTASVVVAVTCFTRLKLTTTPGVPMETPLASQTRNFAGTVLPCLNTLDPSVLIGGRMACPASPSHVPLPAYCTE